MVKGGARQLGESGDVSVVSVCVFENGSVSCGFESIGKVTIWYKERKGGEEGRCTVFI